MTSALPPDDGRSPSRVEAQVVLAAAEVLTAERERMLRNSHDEILDDLLAAAIAITALTHEVAPAVRLQLTDVLESLERAVAVLRAAMLDRPSTRLASVRPATVVHEVAATGSRLLGFEPTVHLDPGVDDIADAHLLGHVVLSMRELLGNVARHAAASSARVTLRVDDGSVELEVVDDGIGIGPDHPVGDGITSLRGRAHELGGTFELAPAATDTAGRGTVARWRVPLRTSRT